MLYISKFINTLIRIVVLTFKHVIVMNHNFMIHVSWYIYVRPNIIFMLYDSLKELDGFNIFML